MSAHETGTAAPTARSLGPWFALTAGALIAVGISITLTTFGAGVGLSVMSGAPTWRDSSAGLWFASGLFLVFVALWAFGFGGYIAGRVRQPLALDAKETAFRDGLFGLTTWALALVLSSALAGLIALGMKSETVSSGRATSTAAETLIPGEMDLLFRDVRSERDASFAYHRAEAGRILLQASNSRGVVQADRDYLAGLVMANTRLDADAAVNRVNRSVANARVAIRNARVAAVMQAFMIATALALGAAIAWFAAVEGGKERDLGKVPEWSWTRRRVAA
jgi:hypothetical protein